MRDFVEIGIGRQARHTYHLDEISIVPTRRTRSSKDVDTTWHIDAYTFDIPVMSHPSDALASPEFVMELGRQGGLGVINAEGLWGRHEDVEAAVATVVAAVDAHGVASAQANKVLQELHAAPIDQDLLAARIDQVRTSGATVAVRVSPQNARELAPQVVKAGAELLIIQGTTISAEHVAQGGEPLNLKDYVGSLDVPVIAGGVYDYTTAIHLMRTGAAGVIVGGGCNTNPMSLGMDVHLATAIADVAAARRDYLDETGGRYVHIIADDGALQTSGDVAKAIACGADAVMLGTPLAAAAEAQTPGYFWPSVAAHPRFPRGLVVTTGDELDVAEQPSLETILHGPSADPTGQLNIVGGLRRAMAKCGYTDLKSFQKVDLATNSYL
ncbi:GuaB3 family IMP dehydrogenase-related protein [Corynebacterium uberis]|uniref:GuaB3 family IMP dehydrogenase-related protein n=1 Tax=Corynebacterium uberis TaxID=2883169 RepID=UPI001D0B0582|nr:GuaB3 family IMP dehydrogenase-related protein [Corynebacterium uberis]UDL76249.1 GuaB3 family IMP dehydrogenase-related protein [Corynebacterium uberis]UDL78461.1 GuaB3 family IMP dehydrogenase-related protein [Corynebacterium uberis]UDL80744.1 GuaB3 family IMP dehydrogenase-related protein [Corynebacterium uberis]UDL82879.1 GuaB3 family IMP dehydrogenase-related protein [Corynebacterium uberis]UDL85086.1 GuaB3 family IMP dehydrogenase-related protein [Corynebacterium uberis]